MPGLMMASVFDVAECRLSKRWTAPNGISRDAERVAGADFDFASFEREGDDAFDAVDGLLVGVVAVGDGDFGSGGDVELEDGDGASGVLAFDQEANR
jgi:hypothetical protein